MNDSISNQYEKKSAEERIMGCVGSNQSYQADRELREARRDGMYHAQLELLKHTLKSTLDILRVHPDAHDYNVEKAIIHIEDALHRIETRLNTSMKGMF